MGLHSNSDYSEPICPKKIRKTTVYDPLHEKTSFLHIRKQRRRSAPCFVHG